MKLQLALEATNVWAQDPDKKTELVELCVYDTGNLNSQMWEKCFAGFTPSHALHAMDSYQVKNRILAAQSILGAYWQDMEEINPSGGGWGDRERFREFLTALLALSEKYDMHHMKPIWKVRLK